jgi:hypothetical protein
LLVAGAVVVGVYIVAIAGGEDRLAIMLAVLVWFGGPPLVVIAVASLASRGRWHFLPATAAGRISLWLVGGCFGFFVLFLVFLGLEVGPDETPEFFSNLYLAISGLAAAACAIGSGIVALYAIIRSRERSALVMGCAAFGLVITVFALGELGADEPGGGNGHGPPTQPAGGNSHSNLSAVPLGDGRVQVSFDYAFNQDPQGWTTDSITVTALTQGQQPLAGAEPVVLPVSHGSDHLDVVFSFTAEQLAQLDGFSVCFTGPGTPDPNPACALVGYAAE